MSSKRSNQIPDSNDGFGGWTSIRHVMFWLKSKAAFSLRFCNETEHRRLESSFIYLFIYLVGRGCNTSRRRTIRRDVCVKEEKKEEWGERWGEGAGFTLLSPPRPLLPSLLPPFTPVGSEDSPQANLRVVRAAANQKAPSSPLLSPALLSSPRAVWLPGSVSLQSPCGGIWRRNAAACGPHHCALQSTRTHRDTRRTHACSRLGEILDAHALDSARTWIIFDIFFYS